MNTRLCFQTSILCVMLAAASTAVAFPQDQAALLKKSSIVFTGTVIRLGASSFAEVPTSPRTIVVRVDAVLKKPAPVSLKNNDDITVEVQDPTAFQKDARVTFYTEGWIFGSGVAAKEIGHLTQPAGEAAAAVTDSFSQVQKQVSDQELQEQLTSADAVVIGRVISVGPGPHPR